MTIAWLPEARQDLENAYSYIARDNPSAAASTVQRIVASIEILRDFPRIGRPGRVEGTRELVVSRTPYIVAYQIKTGTIEILAVIHGARRWPDRF